MGGIGQYFHGEEGEVTELFWAAGKERLFFTMLMSGNPYHKLTYDYGSDIGIDPALKVGCRTVYVRMDDTCGLWVEKGHELSPDLDEALERCKENRDSYIRQYYPNIRGQKQWLEDLAEETGFPVSIEGVDPPRPYPTPSRGPNPISMFLSYSHKDVLLAREFFEALTKEASIDTWLDLAQSGNSLAHDADVAEWLRKAIDRAQLFMVLLTKASAASEWVQKEVAWAAERSKHENNFRLLILNLDDSPIPPSDIAPAYILNCKDLAMGVILEELYAFVDGRPGRSRWREEQLTRGADRWTETARRQGEDLMTGAGVAVALKWERREGEISWALSYLKDGEVKRVEGSGPNKIVDLGIRPGDKIAFIMYNGFFPLWMRSDDLTLTPQNVLRHFEETAKSSSP